MKERLDILLVNRGITPEAQAISRKQLIIKFSRVKLKDPLEKLLLQETNHSSANPGLLLLF